MNFNQLAFCVSVVCIIRTKRAMAPCKPQRVTLARVSLIDVVRLRCGFVTDVACTNSSTFEGPVALFAPNGYLFGAAICCSSNGKLCFINPILFKLDKKPVIAACVAPYGRLFEA